MRKTNSTHRMKIFGIDDLLVGAAISGIGSSITGIFNKGSVEDTNAANAANVAATNKLSAEEAQRNRDYQERMSNTAYQRGMSDMRLSGLNPILAYQKGGASSPTGSQAAFSAAKNEAFKMDNPAPEMVNTALSLRRSSQEIKNLAETEKNIAADTALKNGQNVKTAAERAIITENLSPAQEKRMEAEIRKNVLQTGAGQKLAESGAWADLATRTTDPALSTAKKAVDVFNPFNKLSQQDRHHRDRMAPTETTRSGSRWNGREENHYEDRSFSQRFPKGY